MRLRNLIRPRRTTHAIALRAVFFEIRRGDVGDGLAVFGVPEYDRWRDVNINLA